MKIVDKKEELIKYLLKEIDYEGLILNVEEKEDNEKIISITINDVTHKLLVKQGVSYDDMKIPALKKIKMFITLTIVAKMLNNI